MKKELIGLNKYLYTTNNYELYVKTKEKLKNKGTITETFINNGYGFEIKLYKKFGG